MQTALINPQRIYSAPLTRIWQSGIIVRKIPDLNIVTILLTDESRSIRYA